MNVLSLFIKRNSLVTFFVLAYVISWGSYLGLSGPVLFPFGSILAAIVVAIISQGRDGLKDLLSRCLRWRVGLAWYFAAVAVPIAIALGALFLNAALGSSLPPLPAIGVWYEPLFIFPAALIDAPIWEDSGWRGFAMPRFPENRTRFTNTLILGLLLVGWHLPLALSAGPVAVPYLITTVISAFVTNWIYYNSRQSALLAMLYHGAANSMGIMFFHGYSDTDILRLYWLLAGMNFATAIVIIFAERKSWLNR